MDSELDRTHTDFDPIAEAEFEAFLDEWMADRYDGIDPDQDKADELHYCLVEQEEPTEEEDSESAYWTRRCEVWESTHGMGMGE